MTGGGLASPGYQVGKGRNLVSLGCQVGTGRGLGSFGCEVGKDLVPHVVKYGRVGN